ncbi:hypothetical protein GCM10010269_78270 [Streptomyces humidus]|uniref:Uncharacterized protein n=1 Tax=Streptomyces humidus TaxID=52259 RepID=A0A918GB08_9ACTN|nr:hypothetical protein [Streptomyces humidus]GGS27969.1 hypothetical protein GCM10010269_78270 [Streptomyces humidus]
MPLAGELTSSLISRAADRCGLPAAGVLRLWTCRNSTARLDGGGVRADADLVLNEAGRAVLAELCGVEPAVLARALPAFTVDDPKISIGREAALPQGRWRAAGAVGTDHSQGHGPGLGPDRPEPQPRALLLSQFFAACRTWSA